MGKKQPKRRAWRKADIEDVEDALEDERLVKKMKNQQSNGSGKKSKKNDEIEAEDLFTVDTKGTFEGISNSSRRELAKAKLFPKKGPNIGMSSAEEAKIARAENKLSAASRPKVKKAPEVFDLWSEPPSSAKAKGSTEFNRLRKSKRPEVRMPSTLHQKVGLAPAVLPAHEGQSMNPQKDAYEDLTYMAAAVEIEKEQEAEEVERKLRPMTAALKDAVGAERLKEMDEEEKFALYRSLMQQQSKEEANDDGEGAPVRKTKAWKQKAQSLRNKQKVKRDLDAKEEQARSQKLLQKSVGEVGSILKDMKEQDELNKQKKEYKESMRRKRKELEASEGVVPKHRKIGGGRFAEEAALLPDTEAAAKGLRAMPLKTSAVKERLSSIVRRGLLPAPNEANKEQRNRLKKRSNRQNNKRKFISPLAKDNLLLR